MSNILLASFRSHDVLKNAADIIQSQEHEILITGDGRKVSEILHKRWADVIVLSFYLTYQDGFEILEQIKAIPELERPAIIWITLIDECGSAMRNWPNPVIANYLLSPFTEWNVVLAVEQLLHRRVIIPNTT